jgi:group I intron endonuclease
MSNTWSVYIHITPEPKVYVGTTSKKPYLLWNYGYGYKGTPFYKAVLQFGWSNIHHEVLATGLNKEDAYDLEKELISWYDSTNPNKGYNRAGGGHGSSGVKISEETRQRLRESHTGIKNPHTLEWNEKISAGNIGKKKPHAGVPRSAECRVKISVSLSKKVCQYDRDGNLIEVFPSIREAASVLNIKNQNISACCRGKAKTAGGFVWKYYCE